MGVDLRLANDPSQWGVLIEVDFMRVLDVGEFLKQRSPDVGRCLYYFIQTNREYPPEIPSHERVQKSVCSEAKVSWVS